MRKQLHLFVMLIIDAAIIAMEWPVLWGEWQHAGARMLRFYTQSSNVLAMITCALCAAGEVVCLVRRRDMPQWMNLLRYVAACCLTVTLIVSACILVPMNPGETFRGFMLEGMLLYLHTLCPLVMMTGCLISGGKHLRARHALAAVFPTVLYGIFTLIMNALRVYSGPYFFFEIYRQSWLETVMWFTVLIGGNFVLAWLLGKAHNGLARKILMHS